MSLGLEGRNALVTGGTSGIGRAIVNRLRNEGMSVAFTGRDRSRGTAVADESGAVFVPADAGDRDACDRAVEAAIEIGKGRLHLFVSNAGMVYRGSIESTSESVFQELVEVNLTAPFRCSRACFAHMRGCGGGSLVHIASDAAIRGLHGIAAYSVTKAGVVTLSELLAAEGAPFGIRANAVCPGAVYPGVQATPVGHQSHAEDPSGWALPASGRFGTGADVAAVVAWLATDEAERVSGATIRVDGAAAATIGVTTRLGRGATATDNNI